MLVLFSNRLDLAGCLVVFTTIIFISAVFINYGGILAHARIILDRRAPEHLTRTADNRGIL